MAYGEHQADSATVGLWHLNGDANDASSSANNGTVVNATVSEFGRFGAAYSFNGSSTYIYMSSVLNGTTDFSVSLWMKAQDTSAERYIIAQRGPSGANGEWIIRLKTTGAIQYFVWNATYQFDSTYIDSPNSYDDDQWHWICATRVSSGAGYLYVDGALVASSAGTTKSLVSTLATCIGRDYLSSGTKYFNGLIDEVCVRNAAYSDADVRGMYALMKGAYGVM